jgi:AraC-type DNA-binding domain-containing proteins
MKEFRSQYKQLEWLYSISHVPVTLLDNEGNMLETYPESANGITAPDKSSFVIELFRKQAGDAQHPMIIFFEPGLLLGIAELNPNLYVLIGLVSPYTHTRNELLKTVGEAIRPDHLNTFCDLLLKQPLMSTEQLKDMICLLTKLCGKTLLEEDILFVDNTAIITQKTTLLERMPFVVQEEHVSHVPIDFETAICSAVEMGNRAVLEKTLFTPYPGRVGCMSSNEERQSKYTFMCLAVLVSRAAIRGGIPAETALNLSDLYCQQADLLSDNFLIQNLIYSMLIDFCNKVHTIKKQPSTSPLIGNCLSYITIHLHETITLEQLSQHVGLCSRSLSMKFKTEMGMGVSEYIHREKIHEAEYLLRRTNYSLSEITSYLNYPTQSYFTQIFKKYKQCTPHQFREMRST